MALDFKLKVIGGSHVGREIPIALPKFVIGRGEGCQLRPKSELISRQHCVFIGDGNTFSVRDFGSRNGTYVNGERIKGETELKHGDHVTVGPLEFEIILVDAKRRPKIKDAGDAMARAASNQAGDDWDIASWLNADEDEVMAADTRELSKSDTDQLLLSASQTVSLPRLPPAPANDANGEKAATPATPSTPGKLPPAPPSDSKDSHDAAANALKKMMRR